MLRTVQVPIYTSSANTSDLPASGIIEPGNQRSRRKGTGSWEPLTGAHIGIQSCSHGSRLSVHM